MNCMNKIPDISADDDAWTIAGALMILLPLLAAFGTFVLLPIMQAG